MLISYNDINLELEKLVFLINADEGNYGIYELVWELGFYPLSISDKYKIATELIKNMQLENLISLAKNSSSNKIEIATDLELQDILDNPTSWYPSTGTYSISLTPKGKDYLDVELPKFKELFQKRMTGSYEQMLVSKNFE